MIVAAAAAERDVNNSILVYEGRRGPSFCDSPTDERPMRVGC